MSFFKRHNILIIAIIAALLLFTAWFYYRNPLTPQVRIGEAEFTVELAMTDEEITRGLGYRDSMPEDHGMLFVFKSIGTYGFWMKGMRFPLDLIWIRDDTVVDITHNAPVVPEGEQYPHYESEEDVNRVLEVNAGVAETYGLEIGDRVEYITP